MKPEYIYDPISERWSPSPEEQERLRQQEDERLSRQNTNTEVVNSPKPEHDLGSKTRNSSTIQPGWSSRIFAGVFYLIVLVLFNLGLIWITSWFISHDNVISELALGIPFLIFWWEFKQLWKRLKQVRQWMARLLLTEVTEK